MCREWTSNFFSIALQTGIYSRNYAAIGRIIVCMSRAGLGMLDPVCLVVADCNT